MERGSYPITPRGDATAYQDSDGKVHMTIRVKPGDEQTAEHEVGHEKDARTNTGQFFKDALEDKKDKGGPAEKAHDDRPVEKRANEFKKTVEKERKKHRQEQKQLRKKKKEGGTNHAKLPSHHHVGEPFVPAADNSPERLTTKKL